jgi:hypothetical protein
MRRLPPPARLPGPVWLTGPSRQRQSGQTIALVALMITVLIGGAAIAVDVGRMVSERRFLQNVVDASALAGAVALISGKTTAEAEAAARNVFSTNAAHDPNGGTVDAPSLVPIYEVGHTGEPAYLVDGILVTSTEVRVAISNDVAFTFGRVVGLDKSEIGARARAGVHGGLLPIAVRQYLQAPGPDVGATSPCPHDENRFMAVFATANTACLGSDTNAGPRSDAAPGMDFDTGNPNNDPANHGPIIAILGDGATPSNAADFRGFIALDIRNFSTETSQVYYNGVIQTTNENALKDIETGWILNKGYPGPAFPPVVSPPHPDNQVAIMSGNSAGLAVDGLSSRFALGEEILVTVYPGHVMAIPDFAITGVTSISLPETGTVDNAGSFKVSRNQAFSGMVSLATLPDSLDPDNPLNTGTLTSTPPIDYSPNPVSPALGQGTRVDMTAIETNSATPGIYALWIRGQAGSPYLTAKSIPLSVKVGDVVRDFTFTADADGKVATNVGDNVSFTLTLTNYPNKNTNFGGPVTISVDDPWPNGAGLTLGPSVVTPSRNGSSATFTVNTGAMAPGMHRFVLRATGMNADPIPRKVTHLLVLTVNVAPTTTPGNDEYLDVSGFAVMRVAQTDANTIWGYAITPVIADPSDPILRRGKLPRLLPW